MCKIIYGYMATTPEDFVKHEISEWGFDYVDEMFDKGYEPTLVNGVWSWSVRLLRTVDATSDNSCNLVLNSGILVDSDVKGVNRESFLVV